KKLLNILSNEFDTHLYTLSDVSMLPNIHNHGPADTVNVMPKVFNLSKINLNITLRSIQSGVPQRIYDILGCGGFLITNYQSEIAELFTPDEDLVMYESHQDLIDKVRYYLANEDERLRIAANGYNKIHEKHTYTQRLSNMLYIIEQIKNAS
ncbi:MAG: glycosyltransferase, partial [Lachnospiraceae bacterium]|nr:glycosyltransferase [Lachnospiraceae bacterium]